MNSRNMINIESILKLSHLEALCLIDNKDEKKKNAVNKENRSKLEAMKIPHMFIG